MSEQTEAAKEFAELVERCAVRGAAQSADMDQSDWIRIWAAARGFLGKTSTPDEWNVALPPHARR